MRLLAAIPVLAGLVAAQTVPSGVIIPEITYSGTGCTAATRVGATLTSPTLIPVPQTRYTARSGANNTRMVDTRLNCQVTVKFNHPAGWQVSVAKADYYGTVKLPQNSEAVSKTTYSYTGQTRTVSTQYYFDGPFDGHYFRNDRFLTTATNKLWGPCGSSTSMVIDSEVRVTPLGSGTTREGHMDLYNLLNDRVIVDWRRC
ncbi:hypothetical protein QBC34DRAFT_461227 [Podospora aff. communis PSN243]|uniref:Secreted protein n=1 Tax=Podospora aff. communis PSN243 TaxID=3040156 RepID=A0AAV9GQS1_9PEZI|nr:hypothetical protein QBC34DRAFT_461227 [Podospora aff. communis PSN243]